MVYFTCNGCGESMKKNQVDKHVMRCRRCEVLSCMDCQKVIILFFSSCNQILYREEFIKHIIAFSLTSSPRGVINSKAGKAAALPRFSDALTLSEPGGADYAQPIAFASPKNFRDYAPVSF